YVPLDPSYPADRIAHILQDAAPSAVLTHTITCCGLPEIDAKVLVIDRESLEIATYQTGNPARSPGLHPGSLAYAIYTSGSTGTPKGALIEHRSLANLIHWHCGTFHVGQGTRCSSVAAAGFDAMVWEVWPPLS